MLANEPVHPTIPVTDIERSRSFYSKRLGLPIRMQTEGHTMYECGEGTILTIFERATPSSGEHTVCSFLVEDLDTTVADLDAAGVEFETFPEMEGTLEGVIHVHDGFRGTWTRDPDGNLIALTEAPSE